MKYEIKELEVGGILDYTFRLFKDHFKFIVTILGVVIIPVSVVMAIVSTALTPDYEAMSQAELTSVFVEAGILYTFSAVIMPFLRLFIVVALNTIAQAALIYGLAHRFLGNDTSAGEALRAVFRRFGSLLSLFILSTLGTMAGLLLLVIPGIYLMFAWYVAVPVLMFEGLTGAGALGRSRTLMKGHKGKAFVLGFLLGLIGLACGMFLGLVPGRYSTAVLETFVSALLLGFNSVAVMVIYFSARCKVESFDLELLTQAVEGAQEEQGSVL